MLNARASPMESKTRPAECSFLDARGLRCNSGGVMKPQGKEQKSAPDRGAKPETPLVSTHNTPRDVCLCHGCWPKSTTSALA